MGPSRSSLSSASGSGSMTTTRPPSSTAWAALVPPPIRSSERRQCHTPGTTRTTSVATARGSVTRLSLAPEPERRVLVAHESHVGPDPEGPAVHADDEVEDVPRVAAGEEEDRSRDQDEHADQAHVPAPAALED